MILDLILLILSIPVGFLIAWLARDELIQGRRYIFCLGFISFIALLVFYSDILFALSFGFITIVSWISILKSYDTRWSKERFK